MQRTPTPPPPHIYESRISPRTGITFQPKEIGFLLTNRILVPEECKRKILKDLHKGQQSVTRTLQNARQIVYWHGITRDVDNMCNRCRECHILRISTQMESMEAVKVPKSLLMICLQNCSILEENVYYVCRQDLWISCG